MEYGESTWFGYGNLISDDQSTHKQAAGAAPQFFGVSLKNGASASSSSFFGVPLNAGVPFYKSDNSNEVYCTGAGSSAPVAVSCYFFGQDSSATFGSATTVNTVSGMLVYKITAPADVVQVITPIATKSMSGVDAGWGSDVNYFLKLH
ncbi:MAG: hypothetical protein QF535_14075 [Anaerolineales bacterium]|nr:hypothetical protein [Anaerolineales bacterium]